MDAWATNGKFQPGSGALSDYAERYTYDPNGNILTLNRTGDSVHPATAQLKYNYLYAKTGGGTAEYVPGSAPTSGVAHLTNQLSSIGVTSSGGASNPNELANQSAFNYQYNEIGQLTADSKAQISQVVWNVYGKILSMVASGDTISFTYDAAGNRISKRAHGITTWYVRDAQGNVMSVYTQGNSAVHGDSLTQTEADVYGSSRLGLLNLSVNCISLSAPDSGSLVRGSKLFELTNHLGNVLETISDKKIQHTSNSSTVDYYLTDVAGANDYYSFGMQMPGRLVSAGNYRYGFNGQEKTDEIAGAGNHTAAEFWEYDPRVGRRWNLDPKPDINFSLYAVFSDNPIWHSDIKGDSAAPVAANPKIEFRIGETGLGPFNVNGNPGDNVLIFPTYGGQSFYGSQVEGGKKLDEANSFVTGALRIGPPKSDIYLGLAWFKEKTRPEPDGFKIDAPTDFIGTFGVEFHLASPIKGLNIKANISAGAGALFGAPMFQGVSNSTVNLRGPHVNLGDPYYLAGVAEAVIGRVDATYNRHVTIFVSTIINNVQTFGQSIIQNNVPGIQRGSAYGSVAIAVGVGFDLGTKSR